MMYRIPGRLAKLRTPLLLAWAALVLLGCSSAKSSSVVPQRQLDETVVVIHGLGRSGYSMRRLTEQFEQAGYHTHVVDYDSLGEDLDQVVEQVEQQLTGCCSDTQQVHFVGHSLGGLLTRIYFTQPQSAALAERLGRVVMIGTPNHGSALVDRFEQHWWMKWMGGTTLALATDGVSQQLPLPPFEAGIIAGDDRPAVAGWISDPVLGEANDGLVAVSSTQLANMADFILLDINHWAMRYDREVGRQAIHFLQHGQFDHPQAEPQ
ncbi:esterase/lipase family protein [Ferrimonas marina]|nr:alpha/beta fold hydrolase [Ferrimonas marina]